MTPERDNATGLVPAEAVAPGIYSADTPGALVDLLGLHSATLLIHVGAGGIAFSNANRIDMVLTHGVAADGSDQAPVTITDLVLDASAPATIDNGIVRSIRAAKAAADIQKVGSVGGLRYLRLTPDFSGAHGTGTPIAATVVGGNAGLRGAV